MKKTGILLIVVVLSMVLVLVIYRTKDPMATSIEALSSDESSVPTFPCKVAVSVCEVDMMTTEGVIVQTQISGLKNDPPKQ